MKNPSAYDSLDEMEELLEETYICAMCGKEEELTTPIDEMIKECEENFNHTPTKEEIKQGIVCDDCYNKPEITRAITYAKNSDLKKETK